jgi:hypothetical protein
LTIDLIFRGFVAGELVYEQAASFDSSAELDRLLPALAQEHSTLLPDDDRPVMLEVEFLNEPDPLQWYIRFGTDPAGMVVPMAVDLGRAA